MFKNIVLLTMLIGCNACLAQLKLPRLVSNGMVLQRNTTIKIWGWAIPGEKVMVLFKSRSYKTIAGKNGDWGIAIAPQKPGGPYEMRIVANDTITLHDILVGDVWICSGQSNMELTMERLKYRYPDEVKSADNPQIRQFTVPDKYNFKQAQKDLEAGEWQPLNSKNVLNFSGVAYFFAKEIYRKYQVPIGLINTALGGSPAEAWISEDALEKIPAYYAELQKFKNDNLIREIENHDHTISNNWYASLNQADQGLIHHWKDVQPDDSNWTSMELPGYWPATDTGFLNGVVWFRKKIALPAGVTGKPARLDLGRIVDADSVFVNGHFAGTTGYQYPPRRYLLPAGMLNKGNNEIVIRVVSNSGRGGFIPGKPYRLILDTDTIDLKGQWRYKTGALMRALPAQNFVRWKPGGLYNAMIAPLVKYAIKGALWYQGEANAERPDDYLQLMKALIYDWRTKWKLPILPFIFVQLPNFMEAVTPPQESNWAQLRQQQLNLLSVPNTAMVVAIDVGEWNDIHPENKKDVGERLAWQAEKLAYGDRSIIPSGPVYRSMETHVNKIILHFSNCGSGLIAKGNPELKYFAIAGADHKYTWAKAIIKGRTVIVWSDSVPHPVAVRYAWANNPQGANLYNREGLPASPFTTAR